MRKTRRKPRRKAQLKFADIFAGCGGLSLGLSTAGWSGVFAIEKNRDAFRTLATNLVDGSQPTFSWPEWLPKEAMTTAKVLSKYKAKLRRLRGKIDLLAGGPPCQGFSLAGRRIHSDPRNSLTEEYLQIVECIKPRFILIENVQGFDLPFLANGGKKVTGPYSKLVKTMLEKQDYTVFSELVDLSLFGVPQTRKRFILIGIKNGDRALKRLGDKSPFHVLRASAKKFLLSKNLPVNRAVTVRQAIADLEISGKEFIPNTDCDLSGFRQIEYSEDKRVSAFVRLMRSKINGAPNSLRLPNHKKATVLQFKRIMKTCDQGKVIGKTNRERLGINKQALTPLHPNRPSATITTLPDDIIHYSEPRILTVRENARIQTFPDWFQFTGQYTTGGKNRRHSCPRYTQVGNAVPPLFAEAIGSVLKNIAS